jgi:uncharacterized protein Yka (UPF0111/DUF47 family)
MNALELLTRIDSVKASAKQILTLMQFASGPLTGPEFCRKFKTMISEYLKAIRKADREIELETNGFRWKQKTTPHKNKKTYCRTSKHLKKR